MRSYICLSIYSGHRLCHRTSDPYRKGVSQLTLRAQKRGKGLTMIKRNPIDDLLHRAGDAIAAGERHFAEAAAYIDAAQDKGATQRQIAEAVGKSAAWVNRLLQWHRDGCKNSPFGPQSKRARVQATKQKKKNRTANTEQEAQTAKANAERAKAEAQKAKAEASKARAEAKRARSENAKAKANARRAREARACSDAVTLRRRFTAARVNC